MQTKKFGEMKLYNEGTKKKKRRRCGSLRVTRVQGSGSGDKSLQGGKIVKRAVKRDPVEGRRQRTPGA